MIFNIQHSTWITSNLNSAMLSSQTLFFTVIYFLSKLREIAGILLQFLQRSFLYRQLLLGLTFVLPLITSYPIYALTSITSNKINGSAPYLTFDGGRSQATNTDALLGISLSDGSTFTPATPNLRENPIVLPVAGQSFADIGMLVPINKDSIALGSLIAPPYNYWGDDDGDGQGINGITATGSLSLSIVDKNNQAVSRNTVLTICNAPYKLTLSNTDGTLKTRYGVPNESHFSASNVSYYINPKAAPVICFAKPYASNNSGSGNLAGPASIWLHNRGFFPRSVTPSSYGSNFPTTGANNFYFDLEIGGVVQPLTWKAVSPDGDIKATMSNSTNTSVRVTLEGPFTEKKQWDSSNPGNIGKPSLPQVFELVGLDNNNNEVIKYGFVLKQWFVSRGNVRYSYANTSWCTNIGYRLPKVQELTNATCQGLYSGSHCQGAVGATPASSGNHYQRNIDAGFLTEWGPIEYNPGTNFSKFWYWTFEEFNRYSHFIVVNDGSVTWSSTEYIGLLCVYP